MTQSPTSPNPTPRNQTPDASADALFQQALGLHMQGGIDAALALYARALEQAPQHPKALQMLGVCHLQRARFDLATPLLERSTALDPLDAGGWCNLGESYRFSGQVPASIGAYARALELAPGFAVALLGRALAHCGLRQFELALPDFDLAIAASAGQPSQLEALYNKGVALNDLRRYETALECIDAVLARQPAHPGARNQRAGLLAMLGRTAESIEQVQRNLAIDPSSPLDHCILGTALGGEGRLGDALAAFDRAIALKPDFAEAHVNRGLVRLMLGDFENGWRGYEWRWFDAQLNWTARGFTQPRWEHGQPIAGRSLLVHAEQGFGDTLQFCRYVPLLERAGARVHLEVQPGLLGLVRGIRGAAQVVAAGDPLPATDLQCPLGSLPYLMDTRLATIPADVPYLHADPALARHWRERLGPRRARIRVGVAWAGNHLHARDRERSIALGVLMHAFEGVDVDLVSLHPLLRVGEPEELARDARWTHFGTDLRDFSDTAALASVLDLVIAVDTSVAHLAGALGLPLWVLLPWLPDFRWLLEREDCPWYPTARLWRQPARGDWHAVMQRLRAALRDVPPRPEA